MVKFDTELKIFKPLIQQAEYQFDVVKGMSPSILTMNKGLLNGINNQSSCINATPCKCTSTRPTT